ncbi:MAG TPA: metalloregulator ArsR/SmtB family transcription factor [Candidatus Borkfalkia avistercoris]|uniref:Metalloregulator ArsR/SmtB family transcription factor n=1 Tax=Candidatus Borkfalkia avistercoris TaxID=2838504 RepID=A0A9D2IDN2_9FIRM|nr:metalloregulator ArsR/SmtB family transcription factor [Candidatus Borkfalkia avistercoris]
MEHNTDIAEKTEPAQAKTIRELLPKDETVYELAELFKMFGDPTRAKILGCLQIKDLCVGEIAEVLGMSVSAVSHQLRVLRGAKLVKGTKEGKEVKYSLDDDHVAKIMECGLTHVNEER